MTLIKCGCGKEFEGMEGKEDTCPDCLRKLIWEGTQQIKKQVSLFNQYQKEFHSAINSNLNTPQALATLHKVVDDKRLSPADKLSLVHEFDEVLGLGLKDLKEDIIPTEIIKLVEERTQAKKDKDWIRADKIRDMVNAAGYVIEDKDLSSKIRKK